ncbi:hypothetical protein MAR_034630 [Mya arenaria]|uniref:Uncharacterized protein n=1 Tax=Mya arenaria TaxID=6604 RepID=A0ABY7EK71_MYAAR|nr:hypothetical protein MAR_034630 [Mya arenaria]
MKLCPTTDKRLRGQGRAIGRGEYSKRRSIDQIVQCEVTDRLLDGPADECRAILRSAESHDGSLQGTKECHASLYQEGAWKASLLSTILVGHWHRKVLISCIH